MPEHVHLLVTEPDRAKLSLAPQMLKQNAARELNGTFVGTGENPRPVSANDAETKDGAPAAT